MTSNGTNCLWEQFIWRALWVFQTAHPDAVETFTSNPKMLSCRCCKRKSLRIATVCRIQLLGTMSVCKQFYSHPLLWTTRLTATLSARLKNPHWLKQYRRHTHTYSSTHTHTHTHSPFTTRGPSLGVIQLKALTCTCDSMWNVPVKAAAAAQAIWRAGSRLMRRRRRHGGDEGGDSVTHTLIGSLSLALSSSEVERGDSRGGMVYVTYTWAAQLLVYRNNNALFILCFFCWSDQ